MVSVDFSVRQEYGAADEGAQLADVAGPGGKPARAEAASEVRLLRVTSVPNSRIGQVDEAIGQIEDVVGAFFSQRREGDAELGEAVVEILAESSRRHQPRAGPGW